MQTCSGCSLGIGTSLTSLHTLASPIDWQKRFF